MMAAIPWYDVKPPARRRIRAKGVLTVLLATLITGTVISTAWAFWTAGAVAGANGAAVAATVDQGATPTASVLGQSVTVSWTAGALSTGQAVDGYLVTRYDASTEAAQTILAGCAGTITATTCTEDGVPVGTWTYTVQPVFSTNWRGAESPKSSDVTVGSADPTAPTNAITVTDASGAAALSTTTVYYRGAGSGSFTLTNAVADADSGPASSETSALSGTATGWAHTPSTVSTPAGGPYVSNVFQWDAGTTSAPSLDVTGRDVAGNTATTTLSFANDSTAPGAGTVTYNNGYTPGRFVTVTFTTGTDDGSGIATRQLQRAEAPLNDGVCDTFGSFTNRGAADPTSPYTDSQVVNGTCYRYRYVVTDRVGNPDIATSANTAKVDYAGAVAQTTGALSHWRLGDDGPSSSTLDSFTGTSGAVISSRTGEVGATWTHRFGATSLISNAGRARRNDSGYSIYDASGTPPSADYAVEADFHYRGALTNDALGILGRWDPASISYYMVRYEQQYQSWTIYKAVNNVQTYFAGWVGNQPLTVGQTYRVRLEMSGSTTTTIRMFVNGVQMGATATDTTNPVTAAGLAGFWDGMNTGGAPIRKTDTAGLHLDNFQVTPLNYPRATDSVGSNIASYLNGPTLAVAGAIPGDDDTAATFDGVNDYVQAVATTGIPTGAGVRSVEAWFTTSSAAQQVLFSYGTPGEAQQFGLWLDAGGASMTAWGFGAGSDKTFTLPAAVNDGAWHHVVKTYDGTSLTIYLDGVALPSQAATRATVMDAYGFGIGAVIRAGDLNSGGYFAGSIDEVSFYTSVLDQTTVTNHHDLGTTPAGDLTGPTGGSAGATGLVGTGARYSTSTSLSIALDAGDDPSGMAESGAELRRATATLTSDGRADGVCGTFGTYTLVATDPVSPQADTVTDQACYSYTYLVADTLGNTTTYTSPDVKVDTTAPAAPGLSFAGFNSTHWSGTGTTVHYRPTAESGGFTATASATDTASGIAAYTFPALGTNWTSTPGAVGTTTYAWSGTPADPGTVGVSATNHATLTSSTGTFTLIADTTAPTAGTVSYPNGAQEDTEVSVSFTTGTDAESGIGTRLLQRAEAPLNDTTCGTFGSFTTVSGGTDPTSPHTDVVTPGSCYMYRYVVADNVGNEDVATSSNVVAVESSTSYVESIFSTNGLRNYYRLGDTPTSADSFTGTAGATLQSRSGEVDATWTKHPSSTGDMVLTAAGRARKDGATSGAVYYSSAVPASADYTVAADIHVQSWLANDTAGLVGRVDPSNALGTYYLVRREGQSGDWVLYARVNGGWTWLGSYYQELTAGSTYRLELEMIGSTIGVRIDGVQRISVTNTAITAAGRGGVFSGFPASGTATVTDTAGMHIDNFTIPTAVIDSQGTNHGTYSGPTLGVAGALSSDTDTAVQFDGSNDYATVARQIADDFSIEFWFKSTQGIGTDPSWTQGAGLVDANVSGSDNDFGVSLRADGRVVAGVGGGGGDTSVVSSSSGHNDGGWHHVVFTRTRSTGAFILYVDGVDVGTATNNTAALTASPTLVFGRAAAGGNFYAGSLDEIAIYDTVMAPATVAAHHSAR